MAKFLILGALVLFASLGSCFFLWPSEELKYSNRSMLETIVAKPNIPSDLETLRYPTEPLLTTWLSKVLGFVSQKIVSRINLVDKVKKWEKVSNKKNYLGFSSRSKLDISTKFHQQFQLYQAIFSNDDWLDRWCEFVLSKKE